MSCSKAKQYRWNWRDTMKKKSLLLSKSEYTVSILYVVLLSLTWVSICGKRVAKPKSWRKLFDGRFCSGQITWSSPLESMVHACFSADAHFYRCTGQTCPKLSLSLSFLFLARSSHSLLEIRPQPQCCDGRWQLVYKGLHVIRKCVAPKMSFLIKRFWSVLNCRMLVKIWGIMWSEIQGHDMKG